MFMIIMSALFKDSILLYNMELGINKCDLITYGLIIND